MNRRWLASTTTGRQADRSPGDGADAATVEAVGALTFGPGGAGFDDGVTSLTVYVSGELDDAGVW